MWNDALTLAEDHLGLDRGTARGTVLIETLPAAFEMDEILYELREHSAGLNAGRWDYIFSAIKRFRQRPEFVTPDRAEVTMTVPFMHAYSELLVKTCHRRGAHAMGGMSRRDPVPHRRGGRAAGARGRASDKQREAAAGFDGTWVAHPDSVEPADGRVRQGAGRPRQPGRPAARRRGRCGRRPAGDRQDRGEITEKGLRLNVNVGIQYISSWLRGNGAAAIYGLMEDAATAEISRSQVWQWIRHDAQLDDGRTVTPELVRELAGRGARDDPRGDRRRRVVRARGAAAGVARASSRRVALCGHRRVRGVPDAAGLRQARGDRERRDCLRARYPKR